MSTNCCQERQNEKEAKALEAWAITLDSQDERHLLPLLHKDFVRTYEDGLKHPPLKKGEFVQRMKEALAFGRHSNLFIVEHRMTTCAGCDFGKPVLEFLLVTDFGVNHETLRVELKDGLIVEAYHCSMAKSCLNRQ